MNGNIPYKEPQFEETSFNCPWCNSFAHMEWSWLQTPIRTGTVNGIKICFCNHCKMYSLWYEEAMIFPSEISVESANNDLPEEIVKDYNEAANIVSISPRGAAALLRLAIQKLCAHLGEKGKDINIDIASLVSKGLPERIQKALDTVRVVGNEAVHPGVLDLNDNKKIAFALFKLVNIIAEKMISEDKEIDNLYAILPEEKRQQIKKRDA